MSGSAGGTWENFAGEESAGFWAKAGECARRAEEKRRIMVREKGFCGLPVGSGSWDMFRMLELIAFGISDGGDDHRLRRQANL